MILTHSLILRDIFKKNNSKENTKKKIILQSKGDVKFPCNKRMGSISIYFILFYFFSHTIMDINGVA
jgi:hypothetical protein